MSEGVAGAPRPRLDRERVLAAAVAILDEGGVRELSMRKVGRSLGVEAMALYRYVPSRESLLDGVVETVMDEVDVDDTDLVAVDDWQVYVRRRLEAVRDVALVHPQVLPLVATRPPAAPWVRPPLRSLAWIESFLAGLISRGFSDSDAVHAYQACASFLLGHLLLEVGAMGVDTSPVEQDDEPPQAAADPIGNHPLLLRLAPLLAADHFDVEFESSMANLLTRIGPGAAKSAVPREMGA